MIQTIKEKLQYVEHSKNLETKLDKEIQPTTYSLGKLIDKIHEKWR